MIKKGLLLFCIAALIGCTYGQGYLDNPPSFIRDPHFAEYKEDRDDLEIQYLHKEITYAEYIKEKDEMDETYAREVQERNDKIISPE